MTEDLQDIKFQFTKALSESNHALIQQMLSDNPFLINEYLPANFDELNAIPNKTADERINCLTPILFALACGNHDLCALLLRYNPDLSKTDRVNQTSVTNLLYIRFINLCVCKLMTPPASDRVMQKWLCEFLEGMRLFYQYPIPEFTFCQLITKNYDHLLGAKQAMSQTLYEATTHYKDQYEKIRQQVDNHAGLGTHQKNIIKFFFRIIRGAHIVKQLWTRDVHQKHLSLERCNDLTANFFPMFNLLVQNFKTCYQRAQDEAFLPIYDTLEHKLPPVLCSIVQTYYCGQEEIEPYYSSSVDTPVCKQISQFLKNI